MPHHSACPITSSAPTSAPIQTLVYCWLSGSPFVSHRTMQVFPSPPDITFFLHVPTHAKHRALSLFLFRCAIPSFPQVLGMPHSCLSAFAACGDNSQSQARGLRRWHTWQHLRVPGHGWNHFRARVTWGFCSSGTPVPSCVTAHCWLNFLWQRGGQRCCLFANALEVAVYCFQMVALCIALFLGL